MTPAFLASFALWATVLTPIEVQSLDPPTSIEVSWRCRAGDDPVFALPGFDDTAWDLRALPERDRASPCFGPRVWYRLALTVPASTRAEPLGISVGEIVGAYEVYVDGVRVGGHGTIVPLLEGPRHGEAFAVPAGLADDGLLVVAVRVANDAEVMKATQMNQLVVGGPLAVGRMPSVNDRAITAVDARVREATAAAVAMSGLFLFVALYHVLVWSFRRDQLAYLWFAAFCFLADTWLASVTLVGTPFFPFGARDAATVGNLVGTLVNVAFIEFFWRFLDKTAPPRRWRIYEIVLGLIAFLGFVPAVGLAATVTAPVVIAKVAMPLFAVVELVRAWRRGSREAKVLTLALVIGAAAAPLQAWVLAAGIHLAVNPAHAVLAIFVLTMAVALAAQFARTLDDVDARARELAETNLSIQRFVPHLFLKALKKTSVREVKRGEAERTMMSVMFCDLRGFTTLAEKMGPEETFRFINGYLERMEPEIHKTGGFINQYLGDGIMALFPAGADAAVDAAAGMARALDTFNAERTARGESPLKIGIGIHTGELMIGTIGGGDQLDSGVVGDVVNAAARLEGITKMYGARVLLSGPTMTALVRPEQFALRPLDAVRAKGKSEPMMLIELLDADPKPLRDEKIARRGELEAALALYRKGQFAEAATRFDALAAAVPLDAAAQAFAERCRDLIATPPVAWDGVLALSSK